MKVVDIANEIYLDAGSPTDTSIPAIAFWIRSKAGWLNTVLFEDFVVDDNTLELLNIDGSEIRQEAIAVLKQLYLVHDLEGQIRKMTNALAADSILQVTDNLGGTSFTRVNRNEVAKTLILFRKDEIKLLNQMIDAYRSLTSQPQQVAGDDTQPGYSEVYPAYRPFWTRVGYGRY
jgi:hypothetical protein